MKDSEAILLDISLYLKDSISEILLISTRASLFKVHLNQIQSGMPGIKLLVSTSFPYLKFIQVKDLQLETTSSTFSWDSKERVQREQSDSWDMRIQRPSKLGFRPSSEVMKVKNQDFLPVYQNFHRSKGQSYSHDLLITMMKELAEKGQIMNDAGWLCKSFSQKARLTMEASRDIIKEAERFGHVHTIERSFTDLKTICFTCLKIDSLSCESLTWALRSLKADEMLPSERAVQSRIKEVFDYKILTSDWETFIESCKNRHVHSKSGSENYSLFSQTSNASHSLFVLKQVPDPVTKQSLILVYPKGEEWQSKDQFIKEGDVLGVKNTSDWNAFVEFLAEYFEGCVAGDDSRAIPGGRYGCAQFLKFCGNSTLKNCSLGKLSYMVQLSIDEYLLRYYRTLLVWVPSTQKSTSDKENTEKISFIQGKIIEILKENREGLSLAQLPLYIKRKINSSVNLAELGFAKLKDLLMTMEEIQVELRGNNHPFAVYKSKKTKQLEEEAKALIEEAVHATVNGITSQKLEKVLNEQLGSSFLELRGSTLLDFIEKNCSSIEMQRTEKLTIFKRKEKNEKVCIKILHESGKCLQSEYFAGTFHSYFDSYTYSNPPGF
jgi:hypothetical protein